MNSVLNGTVKPEDDILGTPGNAFPSIEHDLDSPTTAHEKTPQELRAPEALKSASEGSHPRTICVPYDLLITTPQKIPQRKEPATVESILRELNSVRSQCGFRPLTDRDDIEFAMSDMIVHLVEGTDRFSSLSDLREEILAAEV